MNLKKSLFKLSRASGGYKVFKWLARHHPRILMYHRVFPGASRRELSPEVFHKQMCALKDQFNVMTLKELLLLYRQQLKIPENTVVITFDDGYSDLYDYVYPVIEGLKIPATFFITAGFVDREFWFWPDKLRYLLEKSNQISINCCLGSLKVNNESTWGKLADFCLKSSTSERKSFISDLQGQLGVTLPEQAPGRYRPVSWKQLKEMSSKLVDIESHSMNHNILSKINHDMLTTETHDSKVLLESHLNQPVKGFCYPNGLPEDFNAKTKLALKSAGYEYAVTAYPSSQPLKNIWEVTRYPIGSSMYEFEKIIYGIRYQML